MIHILIADPLSEEGMEPLQNEDNINIVVDTDLTKEGLKERIAGFDAVLVRSHTHITRDVMAHAPQLQIIGRAGVGVDNIDIDAATEHGIIVANAPDGNTNSAAEHTMAMLMALSRKIPQAHQALQNRQWDRKTHIGVELKGKTLGIVGLGRIGTEVARLARGQQMDIIASDPFLTPEQAEKMGISHGSMAEVLESADFITLHTPLLEETKHLIDNDAFQTMKQGVQIINCARGGIIDEDALYHAIVTGKVAGAALDGFEEEPATDSKLLELPEVIATPHLGANTFEAQKNVAIDVSRDIIRFFADGQVHNPVNLPSVPSDVMKKIEPYFHLAEKLATFLIHLTDETIEEISISYSGELSQTQTAPLKRNAVKGVLKRHLGNHVNDVNALYLAENKGISVVEKTTGRTKGFTNLLTIEVKSKFESRSAAGTLLNGLGPRIVTVDHFRVDVSPTGHIVVIHHTDQPGVIGKMGEILGEHQVNIATMQVDRSDIGGEAIMLLKVDRYMGETTLKALRELDEINSVTLVDL